MEENHGNNTKYSKNYDFDLIGGAFDEHDFEYSDFETSSEMDYKVYNIQNPCRWFKFKLSNNVGNISFQGYSVFVQSMTNKE